QRDVSVLDLALRELGDRRRLARPVDADEQPYGRPVRRVVERAVDAGEVVDDLLAQEGDELLGVVHPRRRRPRLQLCEQPGGRRHADVGDEKRLLDAVPGLVVDRAPPGERAEGSGEGGARLAEPVAQARWTWWRRDAAAELGRLGGLLGRRRRFLEPLGAPRQAEPEPD